MVRSGSRGATTGSGRVGAEAPRRCAPARFPPQYESSPSGMRVRAGMARCSTSEEDEEARSAASELEDSRLLHELHQDPALGLCRELLFKFLVIGDFGVGKTAIVKRYTEGKFSTNYKITIGADFAIKQIRWDRDTKVNLQLWDIAGHERFGYMTRVYYKYAVAAAVVFDVSRLATFQSVQKWVADVRDKVALPDGSALPLVLLANKCDIPDSVVTEDEVSRLCRDLGIAAWFATSAKENLNIEEALRFLVGRVLRLDSADESGATAASSEHIVLHEACSMPRPGLASGRCGCG